MFDEDKMLFQSFFEAFIPILKEDIEALTNKNKQPRPEVQAYLKKESSMPDLSKLPPEKLALLEQFLA